jgi:hypothetical protein
MKSKPDRLTAFVAEVLTFVAVGAFTEWMFFQEVPKLDTTLPTLEGKLLFGALMIAAFLTIALGDLKHVERSGIPFAVGVILLAYAADDWYSGVIGVLGLIAMIIVKVNESE